jgi:sugar phosphate isomerase/epimerase
MRAGISSWTYPWSIGMAGFPTPRRPFRLSDLLARASLLRVGVVQIADNLPLDLLDSAELNDARDQALELGLSIEVGTRGVEPERLLRYLELATILNAGLVRTLISCPGRRLSLEEAEPPLRGVLPQFADSKIVLGLENYEAHTCTDLANLVRRLGSDYVGICLDTVNSLGALEPPEYVVETLAPLTVNLHIKDFVIDRVPSKMGFTVRGAQAGCGMLDVPSVLKQMPQEDLSVILEQWPPLDTSIDDAVALEQEWAARGVEYLHACGCT